MTQEKIIKKIPRRILLATMSSVAVTISIVVISIASAGIQCDPPQCFEVSLEGKNYRLKGEAAIAYNDLVSREIDYHALRLELPFVVGDQGRVAITLDGPITDVESFVRTYKVEVMKTKISPDKSNSVVFGMVTKGNLNKFFASTSLGDFQASKLGIAALGGYTDETGFHGPFTFLTEEQSNAVGNQVEAFKVQRLKEIVAQKPGVEVIQQ